MMQSYAFSSKPPRLSLILTHLASTLTLTPHPSHSDEANTEDEANATDGKKSARVIPASLQMLVENAIKHNIATTSSPLVIHISINRKSIIVSNNLQLRSYVGSKNGIGLANLRNQYALHDEHLKIQKNEKEFIVELPYIKKEFS